jgi:hypothetical protein
MTQRDKLRAIVARMSAQGAYQVIDDDGRPMMAGMSLRKSEWLKLAYPEEPQTTA